ncbi:phenylalanyl-tRNA synthetase alpha chain, putative [Plasmodium reichenowi]|uniref:Phenylalanyl-tRNA synthetase alpha chain, putative n=1 Tax=Plasmodium reichenowi TaxID=5854 RepID=A0A060S1F1_PLARE|nr:phenylalanyl-tRNA synthetase alpha chain, putative [Plasmodium reichenowi]
MFFSFFICFIFVTIEFIESYKKNPQISDIYFRKLNKNYHIKDDIINYNRFKYVYKIKNHPLNEIKEEVLNFLKKKTSFYLVYNKCPLYYKNLCFKEILIRDTNETTSIKNNFYFSHDYLYIPQATSLFPYIYDLLKNNDKEQNIQKCNDTIYVRNNPYSENTPNNNIDVNKNIKKKQDNYINKEIVENNNVHIINNSNILNKQRDNFCIISNIFRKDNIDKLHFPFFNQIDIYFKITNELVHKKKQLVYFLCELLSNIFGPNYKWRIRKDSFDFTTHSLQAEVFHNNKWIEILGSGILKRKIIFNKKKKYEINDYLAVGIGLDRIAMIKWDIDRIRDLYLYIYNTEKNIYSVEQHNEKNKCSQHISNDIFNKNINEYINHNDSNNHNNVKNYFLKSKKNENQNDKHQDENILLSSPKLEGQKLRHNLLTHIKQKIHIQQKQKSINIPHEEVLYFSNLYNIKDEQRDLSFYSNEQWNNEDFIKNIMELKNIKNLHFLKTVYLFDIFLNEQSKKTSYAYKFIYTPTTNIKEQHVFKNHVKELHEQIITQITKMYNIIIR